ncbi:hypothetical protein DXA30_12390 [Fusobacterium ulcerans]|uniref:hypothetical protein n=1 Tax=Fusobacterium ulcerans TaxID=861 RepID=UPI000E499EE0|nr:hypothetical protein [Fusobacterium ulcerans]RGY62438.1 hypothetical protein DXA30_12390 [Fusobacterium ulcerans]
MNNEIIFNFLDKENFNDCVFKIPRKLNEEKILDLILKVKKLLKKERDNIQVEIYNILEYEELNRERIEEELESLESDTIITITIRKIFKEKVLSIYSLEKFSENMKKMNLEDIIIKFSKYLNQNLMIYFELITNMADFRSSRILFSNNISYISDYNPKKFQYIFLEREELCNIHSEKMQVLPNDFYLIKQSGVFTEIEKIFNKITTVLSILSIANISFLDKNNLNYEINGYKTLKSKIDLQNDNITFGNTKIIFEIYSWIYKQDNSILERMEVSRNVITLYSLEDNLLKLNLNVIYSIKSAYEIYLKKNVDRYIKVLGEISILLDELENKFILTKDEFKNKFKNTLITFFTFIFSTLLFNTLSTGRIENIFTKDITILSIVLVIFAQIYLFISLKDLDNNFDYMKKSYGRKQKYFSVILNKDDIDLIFSKDNFLEESEKEIKELKDYYIKLWIIIIIIIILIALFFLVEKNVVISIMENLKIFIRELSTIFIV